MFVGILGISVIFSDNNYNVLYNLVSGFSKRYNLVAEISTFYHIFSIQNLKITRSHAITLVSTARSAMGDLTAPVVDVATGVWISNVS